MKDMPKTVEDAYESWITNFPADYHPLDRERFYIFIHILSINSKKQRTRDWLIEKLKEDTLLPIDEIERLGDEFETLMEFAEKRDKAKYVLRRERTERILKKHFKERIYSHI
jgi:hypothetical protein